MASRKGLGRSPPPTYDEAEKTEVSFMPDLGLDDEPTEDTDKHAVPKLRLPVPQDDPPPPQAVLRPPAPPAEKEIPLFRVQPEKSGSARLVLGTVAVLFAVVGIAFAVAPGGKHERLPRAESRSIRFFDDSEPPGERASSDGDGERAQRPNGLRKRAARRGKNAPVVLRRHADAAERERQAKVQAEAAADPRYGFERVQQVRRSYDNFDTTKEQSNGIPMLMVFSKPAGMSVDVDGKLMGMTPLIRPLPKDTKRVKVRLHGAGFREWEQTVSADALDRFRVGVTMQRIAE